MKQQGGFTLVELVVVLVVLGIIAGVAMRQMGGTITTAQVEHTKSELDQLAKAIVGSPDSYSMGSRSDFGYVGDIGGLPSSINDLYTKPGGSWSTWNGPYVERGIKSTDFKKDAWGVDYVITGTTLRSTGSGSNIDKLFASSSTAVTSDTITGTVVDANMSEPGDDNMDSLKFVLTCPNGSGGTTTKTTTTDQHGRFTMTGVPIGYRTLRLVFIPGDDTLSIPITLYPGRTCKLDIVFPADLF